MIWYQAAYDMHAPHGKQWTVLRMQTNSVTGQIMIHEISRWPTRHEAEGHAKKAWEKLGR